MTKETRFAKLILCYVATNILTEGLDEHGEFAIVKLFQHGTKKSAKIFLSYIEKDIERLYRELNNAESIEGFTQIFDVIKTSIHQLSDEVIQAVQLPE